MMPNGMIFVNPVAGLDINSFTATFKVRVIDSSGSFTEFTFDGRVSCFIRRLLIYYDIFSFDFVGRPV